MGSIGLICASPFILTRFLVFLRKRVDMETALNLIGETISFLAICLIINFFFLNKSWNFFAMHKFDALRKWNDWKVPAKWNRDGTFRHTLEGDDDMPGHVKSSLMGPSLNIPVSNSNWNPFLWLWVDSYYSSCHIFRFVFFCMGINSIYLNRFVMED